MNRPLPTLLLALAAMLYAAGAARAQAERSCAPREDVIARLSQLYGESRRAFGLSSDNRVMELFASERTGSWSLIVTLPNGLACLVSAGEAFEDAGKPATPAGEGA
jgi:hypothetical protein